MPSIDKVRPVAETKKAWTPPPTYVEGFHDIDAIKEMEYSKLGATDMIVSKLSFGGSSIGGCYGTDFTEEEAIEIIQTAIRSGINYIDTAAWYGYGFSETIMGKALQSIPRKAYYIATKCGRYFPEPERQFDFSYDRTLRSVQESLKRLQLDYVDVMQVHDPEFAEDLDQILKETLPALEQARKAGLFRYLGMTGYDLSLHKYYFDNTPVRIDLCLVYCHTSLNDMTFFNSMCRYLQEKDVGIIHASPLSMGLLTKRGTPQWHPGSTAIKKKCREAVEMVESQLWSNAPIASGKATPTLIEANGNVTSTNADSKQEDLVAVTMDKLGLWYSIHGDPCNALPSCLFSTKSLANLHRTLAIARRSGSRLSPGEHRALRAVRTLFETDAWNSTDSSCCWTGREVEKFHRKLNASRSSSSLGSSRVSSQERISE